MGLINSKTQWIFLLPSSNEADVRHICDIAFGIKILLHKNVSIDDIFVVIENYSFSKVESVFKTFNLESPKQIYNVTNISTLANNTSYEYSVIFITGHGSPTGLDSTTPIKPFPLYSVFQRANHLKTAVFFFGQCFAGIFDKLPLKNRLNLPDTTCNIVAVGGTGFYPSVSLPTEMLVDNKNVIRWQANTFLFYIFDCISKDIDIDGDGNLTVTDIYKYASIKTCEEISNTKRQGDFQSLIDELSLMKGLTKLKDNPDNINEDNLELDKSAFIKMLSLRYIVQEPWILNTNISMETSF